MKRQEEASKMRCLLQALYNALCENSFKDLVDNDLCKYPLKNGEDIIIYKKLKDLINEFEKGTIK